MNPGRRDLLPALVLIAPFVIIYLILFVYPTIMMVQLTFTDSPLIGEGKWVGFDNYVRLWNDRIFLRATSNTFYFVLLTVVPTTIIGLVIAMMVSRLTGWFQSVILAAFFLPYVLPVTVVATIWEWVLNIKFGVGQHVFEWVLGERVSVFRDRYWAMPMVAFVTIWWTNGFNVLLFIAGLRNIPPDFYEAASLDGATRLQQLRYITLPLIWPIAALVLTIQLILQLKIFDQVHLLTEGGPARSTEVLVRMIYLNGFNQNKGGYAATIALFLFMMVIVLSVFQYQLIRRRRWE